MAGEKDPRLNRNGRYVSPAGLSSISSRVSAEISGNASKKDEDVLDWPDVVTPLAPSTDPRRGFFPRTPAPAPYPGRLPVRNFPLDTSS